MMLVLFDQRMHFYLTYKLLKFTLKLFFTVTPTVNVKKSFHVNFNM